MNENLRTSLAATILVLTSLTSVGIFQSVKAEVQLPDFLGYKTLMRT